MGGKVYKDIFIFSLQNKCLLDLRGFLKWAHVARLPVYYPVEYLLILYSRIDLK
jgi:hypothetical protein